jgi:uncharacterized protein YbcC (UPF0753/DUF2309 family)
MKTAILMKNEPATCLQSDPSGNISLIALIEKSWHNIAPFWPLKNLIAVNPLQGLEDISVEQALKKGVAYFQQADLPSPMLDINRESIKWLQAFFDDGQATLPMPLRHKGLFQSWRLLAPHDSSLLTGLNQDKDWLKNLPETPEQVISECFLKLSIPKEDRELFLTLMLTTLPGWAAHVKYRTDWAGLDASHPYPVTKADYLAIRLVLTCLFWPEAKALLDWHSKALESTSDQRNLMTILEQNEHQYRAPLLADLSTQPLPPPHRPEAQLVFCIDVRSEPFRRALEATSDYETLGFAGFFGIPVQITDAATGESHASCPVLLSPQHEIVQKPCCDHDHHQAVKGYERTSLLKRLYQSLKYTFTTPFALVEALGWASGAWMGLRTLTPALAARFQGWAEKQLRPQVNVQPSLQTISLNEKCHYALGALRMMGLTHHFAPLVVFCGHGSTTHNNAYATALDCGACGGRHGAPNAQILAAILNMSEVRSYLAEQDIVIPEDTHFLAAEHNTTTDHVVLYGDVSSPLAQKLQEDLDKARQTNSAVRLRHMQTSAEKADPSFHKKASRLTWLRSQDWAQVRPEWGLARNAAFIVGPRDLTKGLDLQGRCFLHSYDYSQDPEGTSLTTILTAPMVVAEWINTQYLFSTLDNVAFGGGSKITKNITGKIGIMQGNASDLMTGLPLQSVFATDTKPYHELQRLMGVVYAPRVMLDAIIQEQPVLQKLFGHGWMQLTCIEPDSRQIYSLNRNLDWVEA